MKQKLFLLLAVMLLVSVNAFAQDYVDRPLEILTPQSPSENGWTLLETTEKGGMTCETYIKEFDDDEYKCYRYLKGEGEFMVIPESKDSPNLYFEFKKTPSDCKWYDENGTLRIYKNGNVRNGNSRMQFVYPNGMVCDVTYVKDINGDPVQREFYLYLPDNPNKAYVYQDLRVEDLWVEPEDYSGNYGFLVDDRFYVWNNNINYKYEDYNFLQPFQVAQKINGKFFLTCPMDTIIDVKCVEKNDTVIGEYKYKKYMATEVYYNNGDHYKYVQRLINYWEQYQIVTLHRKDGVLKVTKKEMTFTKNDGSVIKADAIYWGTGRAPTLNDNYSFRTYLLYFLTDESPTFSGVITYPDGKTETITRGKTKSYLAQVAKAEKEIEEAKKKADYEKKRAPYIKKWGFYPGDYTYVEAIKPGRPWGAIEEFFLVSLVTDNGRSKRYKVAYGDLGNSAICYVWVTNGKILSVTW